MAQVQAGTRCPKCRGSMFVEDLSHMGLPLLEACCVQCGYNKDLGPAVGALASRLDQSPRLPRLQGGTRG